MFSFLISHHCSGTNDVDVLEPLKERYNGQHYSLRKFYYECSNLKYLTGLINVPKLGHVGIHVDKNLALSLTSPQEPPNLMDSGDAPDLPARPQQSQTSVNSSTPTPTNAEIDEQARILKQYEDQQAALQTAREAEERHRQEAELAQQREFERRQREQEEAQRLAQEQLMQAQMQQQQFAVNQEAMQLQQEILAMRGQYERDQIFLEQYDRVSCYSPSRSKIHRFSSSE